MLFLKRISDQIKRRGFGNTFTYGIQKWLGISKLQEETSALFYFLDQHIDPKEFTRTKNEDLRILQDCDTFLLGIFDKMCRKHGLTYWIEYGTLLGAVRHAGFIPWDDDTDMAMPRGDFEKELLSNMVSMKYHVSNYTTDITKREFGLILLRWTHLFHPTI